jgi:hypothetical protein
MKKDVNKGKKRNRKECPAKEAKKMMPKRWKSNQETV